MSFDTNSQHNGTKKNSLNPFGTGQCLSTQILNTMERRRTVSIPLEQGNVFRRRLDEGHQKLKGVSIPLEQGNVFRQA